jgi:deoxyribodipyrimidine photo-lyase
MGWPFMSRICFWFRRDLRLYDNVGLRRARDEADKLFTVYLVDGSHEHWPHRNGDRLRFKLDCVRALADDVESAGGTLIRRVTEQFGEEFLNLSDELDLDAVYWNRAYEPYERERDERVREALTQQGVSVETFKDQVLFEKREITTQKDDPYKVFTPYSNNWKSRKKPSPVEPVESIDSPEGVESGRCPSVDELGLETRLEDRGWPPGESAARDRMREFLREPVLDYDEVRDRPDLDGTSRLSPYLRFGLLSVRELYRGCRNRFQEADRTEGIETFVDELIWRDFYHQILWNFPRVATGNFHQKYDALEWRWDERQFEAWTRGETGYPIVDAAMRQLNETGWMHNRLRMIVASFLTKDLLIHWKHGERYFMNRLLDGDTAANNGGWQWAASTGTDAVPYFRIFNPVSQSEKYDPEGDFIRSYCPELSSLSADHIHAPFDADRETLAEADVSLGDDYPEPIVNHTTARERALERFEAVSD